MQEDPKDKEKKKGGEAEDHPSAPWILYVVRCQDDTLYCGITNCLDRRLEQHNEGKGARYTRGRGPVVLVKSWRAANHSAALRAEYAFKCLSRPDKERKLRSRKKSDPISLLLKGE